MISDDLFTSYSLNISAVYLIWNTSHERQYNTAMVSNDRHFSFFVLSYFCQAVYGWLSRILLNLLYVGFTDYLDSDADVRCLGNTLIKYIFLSKWCLEQITDRQIHSHVLPAKFRPFR